MRAAGIAVLSAAVLALSVAARAQQTESWRLHTALEGKRAPALCRDRDSAALIAGVQARMHEARAANQADRAQRLQQIAAQLQTEICLKAADDDLVILRCKLSQAERGGVTLSLIKVSSLLRAEAPKGEQPFFAVTSAAIDETGSNSSEAQEAARRWCGEEAQVSAPLNATPDIVMQVQQRLYDFGLRIAEIDGQLSDDTVQALTAFQKWANLPVTGQLDKQTFDKIVSTPAPSPWVAFAFDGFGNYGADTGPTRRAAESEAIRKLRRRSRAEFRLAAVPGPSCIGFAVTRYTERGRRSRTRLTQAFTSAGNSVSDAAKNANDFCERQKGGGECDVRYVLCANGDDGLDAQGRSTDPRARSQPGERINAPVNPDAPRFDLPLDSPPLRPGSAGDTR